MKIKKANKSKKIILILLCIFALAAAAVLLYSFLYRDRSSKPSVATTSSSASKQSSDSQQAQNLKNQPEAKQRTSNTDKPVEPTSNTATKQQIELVASVDTSNGTVYVRGGINYPVTGGSCYVVLSDPSSRSIRKDTTVLQNPASTDCKTISIPASDLTAGKWTGRLHYTSDNYEGTSNEITFSI